MTDSQDRVALTLTAWAAGDSTVIQAGGDIVVHRYSDGTIAYDARPSSVEECPYPGLKAFDQDSAHWFFGRERLLAELAGTLHRCVGLDAPAAVVAPSGAGKSSLLRAGLLPALARGEPLPGSQHWPQLLLRPTEDPVGQLAEACARLTETEAAGFRAALDNGPAAFRELVCGTLQLPPGHRVVIVVDQLEELFTQCHDESARTRFVDALAALTPLALIVYGLRADRYGDCTPYPHLLSALRNNVIVGAMTEAEVRAAIESPVTRVDGLSIDPRLTDAIVRDLRAGAAQRPDVYPPGRLPFLSQALLSTWQQRTGDRMTLAAYRTGGGIDDAVNQAAQRVYDELTDPQKDVARALFTGLVRVDEQGETTFRRRTRRELLQEARDPAQVPPVVDAFTEARLLTQNGGGRDGETVEITHEALLRGWDKLDEWIAPDKQGSLVRQEVWEAAVRWSGGEHRDKDVLFRGNRLDNARLWADSADPADVTPLAADFLHASGAQERRARRLRRGAVAVVSVLALIASGLALYALDRRREAVEQRDEAIFNRVTAEADRLRGTDSALAAQLDLTAYDMRPTDTLRTRLLAASGAVLPQTLPDRFGLVHTLAFGPGGHLMTAASTASDTAGQLRLWNVPRTEAATPLAGPIRVGTASGGIQPLAYDRRNNLLVWGSSDGLIRILDVSDPAHPQPLADPVRVSPQGTVGSLALGSDGRTLAVGTTTTGMVAPGSPPSALTSDVQLWSLADPRAPRRLSTPLSVRGQGVQSVALTPDLKTLVACGGTAQGGTGAALLKLWDVSDPARPEALPDPRGGHSVVVNQIAISPDGRTLATASSDYRVLLWNLADPRHLTPVNQLMLGSVVNSVAFSPDGQLLVTGDTSGGVNVWNVRAPARARVITPTLRGHSGLVGALAFSPDSRTIASGGGDGFVRLWRLPPALAIGDEVLALAVTPDGRRAAVATGNRVTLWDVSAPDRLVRLGELPPLTGSVNALAFRPGARPVLATGEFTGAVRLWDVTSPARPVALSPPLTWNGDPVSAVAFGGDGTTLVAGYLEIRNQFGGGLRAWDISDPGRPTALGKDLGGISRPVRALVSDPADGTVFSADMIGMLRAWRVTRGAAPTLTGYEIIPQIVLTTALSRDGRLIATAGGDSRLHLWNVSGTGAPRMVGDTLTAGAMLNSADFSPDGKLLASGDAIGEIRLWNTADPTHAALYGTPVPGHAGSVSGLRFLPHGTLLSTGNDGTVRLWQTAVPQARALICAASRTALTKEAWREHVSADLPYHPPCG
ncbi:nSTAND1 domain-containing NTPase [Streptomyces sp. S6]